MTFAINRLVLLIPNANPGNVHSVYSLRSGGRKLSIGTAGVPIGAYTRQLLRAHAAVLDPQLATRVSQQTNVGQVASQVALGSADAGFVYYTDGLAVKDRTRMISLPKWAQPPVRYQICTVAPRRAPTRAGAAGLHQGGHAARPGAAALKAYGFGLPPREVRRRAGRFTALLALVTGITLAFLAIPIVALFTAGAAARRPGPARASRRSRTRSRSRCARTSSPTR